MNHAQRVKHDGKSMNSKPRLGESGLCYEWNPDN